MKRVLFLLGLCLAGMANLLAQEIITGTVIDEKNQPVPGARVEADGRSEYTVTDIDGRFRFEVPVPVKKVKVSYVGYKALKRKVQPDMVVKLRKGWKAGPQEYQWFAGANLAVGMYPGDYSIDVNENRVGFGLMGGYVKNWGFFVNPLFGFGDRANRFVGFTVGGIRRLWCPLHMYMGFGYGRTSLYNIYDNFTFSFGWMFRFGKFGINYGGTGFFNNYDPYMTLQLGLNYFF